MRTKKVNRYWCDFCNKGGLSAGHMRTHEKHCTLNPGRECRVCAMLGSHSNVAELMCLLPDPTAYHAAVFDEGVRQANLLVAAVTEVLPKLREDAGNCPACIMAAFRQKKIPVPMVEGFSFTDEMKSIWSEINDSRQPY